MINTDTIILQDVPLPTGVKNVPIHIIRIQRVTGAVIELDGGSMITYSQFASASTTRHPKDADDPAIGERIAVRRACCNFDGDRDKWRFGDYPPIGPAGRIIDYPPIGPAGRIIYRAYRMRVQGLAK